MRTTRDVFEEHLIRQLPLEMCNGNSKLYLRLGEEQRGFETVGEKVEFTDFEKAIEEERKRSAGRVVGIYPERRGQKKNNRTLVEQEDRDGGKGGGRRRGRRDNLPLAVEERKSVIKGNG